MGAGASALQEMDEIITCTFLLGRAITAMQFPDMYRIQSFHSAKAPPLESDVMQHFTGQTMSALIMNEDQHLANELEEPKVDENWEDFDYEDPKLFVVEVNDEKIVIDDVAKPNEDGWTPLHACCHSQSTVSAGLAIIEEMKQRRCGFEQKTLRGPGAGNEGWTALHMAAAYGIAPLVVCLIAAGANANTLNSLTWSPLNEACHRGFVVIARELISVGRADVKHMPDVEAHRRAPFARPPPQSPLGEAARCGFYDICTVLLESGAPTDLANYVGWTPLHEAAFYNHLRTVKVLLSFGADACTANGQGVFPYQLASSEEVKAVIKEIGGDAAVEQKPLTVEAAEVAREATAPMVVAAVSSPQRTVSSTAESKASPNLHSGAMLGELPALSPAPDKVKKNDRAPSSERINNSGHNTNSVPENFPKHLLCAICERPLQDPVRSPYGGLFERKAIHTWIDRNGSVCPLTGQPLVMTELQDAPDIKAQVRSFFEKPKPHINGTEEDLYDF